MQSKLWFSSFLIRKLAKAIAQLSFKNLYYEKSRFVLFAFRLCWTRKL
jgi:hypothetical protein